MTAAYVFRYNLLRHKSRSVIRCEALKTLMLNQKMRQRTANGLTIYWKNMPSKTPDWGCC
jgi:uncharacterized protein HemY